MGSSSLIHPTKAEHIASSLMVNPFSYSILPTMPNSPVNELHAISRVNPVRMRYVSSVAGPVSSPKRWASPNSYRTATLSAKAVRGHVATPSHDRNTLYDSTTSFSSHNIWSCFLGEYSVCLVHRMPSLPIFSLKEAEFLSLAVSL